MIKPMLDQELVQYIYTFILDNSPVKLSAIATLLDDYITPVEITETNLRATIEFLQSERLVYLSVTDYLCTENMTRWAQEAVAKLNMVHIDR